MLGTSGVHAIIVGVSSRGLRPAASTETAAQMEASKKIVGPFLGVIIIRIIVYWGPCFGDPQFIEFLYSGSYILVHTRCPGFLETPKSTLPSCQSLSRACYLVASIT